MSNFIEKLKQVAAGRTPGEWRIFHEERFCYPSSVRIWSPEKHAWDEEDEEYNTVCDFPRSCEYGRGSDSHIEPDAQFIALAANCFDELVEVAEAAKKTLGLNCINGKHASEGCFDCLLATALEKLRQKLEGEGGSHG